MEVEGDRVGGIEEEGGERGAESANGAGAACEGFLGLEEVHSQPILTYQGSTEELDDCMNCTERNYEGVMQGRRAAGDVPEL